MEDLLKLDGIKSPIILITWLVMLVFSVTAIYYLINIGNRYLERSKRLVIESKSVKRVIIGICFLVIIIILLRKFPIIGRVLAAAFVAAILAYVINPLVDRLEARGFSRMAGVGIVFLSILAIFGILLTAVIPKTILEVRNLAKSLPGIVDKITYMGVNLIEGLSEIEVPGAIQISNTLKDSLETTTRSLMEWVTTSASRITVLVTNMVQNIVSVVFTLILVFIMTFYFSVDKKLYVSKVKKIIPESINEDFSYLAGKINVVLTEFIRGRLILAIFVGVLTTILLLILKIDFAIVIGTITFVADIIPYIGPLLGFVPAFLFALIESPIKALIVAVFYVFIQWAENNIMAPKIIGDSMGLHPLFIFLAIVIGGGMFGVWGMVVSVPLAAIGLILIDFGREKYKIYKEEEKKDGKKA